jgi:hypothetical protein
MKATTLQDVRLELAREEAGEVALGVLPRHKTSLTSFLMIGFELEDSQYVPYLSIQTYSNPLLDTFFIVRLTRKKD